MTEAGNLAKVQAYLAGKTYDLEYDFLDRLMRVTDESGQRYQYFYDANNNMTELAYILMNMEQKQITAMIRTAEKQKQRS